MCSCGYLCRNTWSSLEIAFIDFQSRLEIETFFDEAARLKATPNCMARCIPRASGKESVPVPYTLLARMTIEQDTGLVCAIFHLESVKK